MRKIFVYFLVSLLLGSGLVALIKFDPGYVLVAFGNYTVETSVWVGLFVLLIFTCLIYFLIRLVRKIWGGKSSYIGWLEARRTQQGARHTNRGIISFIEGNWSKSRRQLLRGSQGGKAPLLNYLLAARASYRLNEPDKMRQYMGLAENCESAAGIAVELTEAELKLSARQYEQALAALVRARGNTGRHPYVLSLLRRAFEGLNDWQSLADLIPELRKYKVGEDSELAALEKSLHIRLFQQSTQTAELDKVHSGWNKLPTNLKKEPELLYEYITALVALKQHEEAGKIVVRSLKQSWNSSLVRLYGLVESAKGDKQLTQAESWLGEHSSDTQLQLCLGRLSARNKLWGKARDYFENSYKLERSAEICAELGRLLAGLGEPNVAAAYFREGLLLSESALPELPLPEKAVSRVNRLASS